MKTTILYEYDNPQDVIEVHASNVLSIVNKLNDTVDAGYIEDGLELINTLIVKLKNIQLPRTEEMHEICVRLIKILSNYKEGADLEKLKMLFNNRIRDLFQILHDINPPKN